MLIVALDGKMMGRGGGGGGRRTSARWGPWWKAGRRPDEDRGCLFPYCRSDEDLEELERERLKNYEGNKNN